jgi:hypothetical protein
MGGYQNARPLVLSVRAFKEWLATVYSPTTSQWQYHRRCGT